VAYITQADLSELISDLELTQLTDDEKLGVVNAGRVTSCIASTSAEIDGYVGVKYALPLATTPALIKSWALAIAKYRLFSRRNRASESTRQGYEDAIDQLKSVARGTLTLGIDPPPTTSSLTASGEVFGPDRVFTRDSLGEW
jgi:phage gp36-like protein